MQWNGVANSLNQRQSASAKEENQYIYLNKNLKIKIYKIIILPVVLYRCEIWFLTLREECRLGYLKTGF